MNEGFIIIVFVALVAVIYALSARLRCGKCDVGKCFNLLVVAAGAVIGVFLFLHALASVRAKAPYEDALWTAIAGLVLSISSSMQVLDMFRELFAKPVEPLKPDSATH